MNWIRSDQATRSRVTMKGGFGGYVDEGVFIIEGGEMGDHDN